MDNKAMYKIGYGLYVLTVECGGRDNGCIVNTVMQVTSAPNRIAVAVNKLNYTGGMIDRSGVFNISVLDLNADFSVFEHFGYQSGAKVDKFGSYSDTERADNGVLYITKNTNAYISGKVIDTTDVGTHILYIADVTDAVSLGGVKTVTYDYYQDEIKPKTPAPQAKGKSGQWKCDICGYVYEGGDLPPDFICPICKHGAEDFSKIK